MGKPEMLKVKGASRKFAKFLKDVREFGVVPISPEREARDQEMQRIVEPDSPRIADLQGQVVLDKEVNGYTLRVPTTYVPKWKGFPKAGKLWVRIVAPGEDGREHGVFTWKTTRTGDFLGRARKMIKFLADRLEQWPIDGQKKLMRLENQVGKSKTDPYIWVGKDKRGKKMEVLFSKGMPPELRPFIKEWKRWLWYFETVVRENRGFEYRERDKRKPYTVEEEGEKVAKKKK